MMKKIIALLAVLTLTVTAVGCFPFGAIVGRGSVETRDFDFSGFTRIEVSTTFDVEIVKSDDFSVSVTTNENLFDYLALERSGDTLWVQLRAGSYSFASLKAYITMPDLFSLNVSGASEGKVSGFDFNHALTLKASGASSIELTAMKSGELEMVVSGASRVKGNITADDGRFNMSGASSVDITGNGGNLDVTASGASSITLRDFFGGNVKVNFSGATSGSVSSSGRLDVLLSGASSLRYYGNPTLGDVNVSGGSSINKG